MMGGRSHVKGGLKASVLAFIKARISADGIPPSYREIALAMGLPDNAKVCHVITRLERDGCLERSGEVRGGRGTDRGRRIRLGTAAEADEGRKIIRSGQSVVERD